MLSSNNNRRPILSASNKLAQQQRIVFDDEPQNIFGYQAPEKRKLVKTIGIFSIIIAVIVFAAIAVISYRYSSKPKSIEEVILVKREAGPLKVQPLEPGGERFSNQDISVYNTIVKEATVATTDKQRQLDALNKLVAKPTPLAAKVEKPVETLTVVEKQIKPAVNLKTQKKTPIKAKAPVNKPSNNINKKAAKNIFDLAN